VPYQLHCVAQMDDATLLVLDVALDVAAEVALELFTELEVELATDVTLDDEVLVALEVLLGTELLVFTELTELVLLVTVVQTDPVTIGFSATPPLVSPCTPKLTDCPGWMVLFQSSELAV
jgi:hypothetical protein